jgi:cell division protein FtsW
VALTGGIIIWSAGAKIGHFLLLAPATILLGLHLIQSPSYQGNRIRNFINSFLNGGDPTSQIHQSLVGFGSGRFLGVGFGEGQQKFGYLPLAYSDFIFSAIGEEWGFLGAVFLVLLFALFCWLGFRIARSAEDPFGQYLAAGLTAAVGVTAAVHMAVCLSLMPTTGVTLPFVSYGRSSLLVTLLGTGVLLSVGRMRGKPSRVGRPPAQVRRPAARP